MAYRSENASQSVALEGTGSPLMLIPIKRAVERIKSITVLKRSIYDAQILPGHVAMAFAKVREFDIERHGSEVDFDPRIAADRIAAGRSAFDVQGV